MMTVPMDNSSTTSSWDHAQDLFKKNIELENGLRKSAQAKIPSDPNVWLQMRENYEAIILEDHEFSEKYEVEYMLWQLHYRRIEEFRLHINAAKSAGLTATQSGRSPTRPDRIKKIRSAFKSFLSESTGFYHDLILKIRAKYGLPLGYFSEGPESQIILSKDEKKSSEMKKGLLSCHRCLIYLGDLARYKGMYGEGDSVIHEFTAASSYYMQAASLCPSSGNPHHQLAILASYSNDDLVTIYRYFRSLAVDNPFSTARDNLIIAFEKNRQRIAQIPAVKTAASNVLPPRATGKGRGRGDGRITAKECNIEPPIKEQELTTTLDIYKSFSTRFVRLHGILFTRTSLETFGDVFSSVTSDLHKLLAAGMEEVFNFGVDASENGLIMVRLVSILIFTVHNVNNRDSGGQSYAEILQRSALLQNAFSACFEFVGHMLKRCAELRDVSSSFLLPGIMVFVEWLACHPDIATGFDVKEKQAAARMFFWDQCVSFMNALLLSGHGYADAYEDETCFSDMGYYEEGETGNRLALWEDFELRGFVPLMRAHLILDFSRKHSMGSSDGSSKEVRARVQRIFAAGRALMNVVKIDQQGIYFDRVRGKFVFGIESLPFSAVEVHSGLAENMNNFVEGLQSTVDDFRLAPTKSFLHADDEEEEEIVFQPAAVSVAIPTPVNAAVQLTNGPNAAVWPRSSAAVISPPLPPFLGLNINAPSMWPLENEAVLSEGFRSMNIENGFSALHFASGLLSTDRINAAADAVIPSPLDSIVMPAAALTAGLPAAASSNLLSTSKRNPVSRPVRHVGPPPGFGHTSFNKPQLDSGHYSLDVTNEQIHDDDYSWLDDYQPSSNKAMAGVTSESRVLVPSLADCNDVAGFSFPGKQIHPTMMMMPSENKWQDFRLFEHHLKPFSEERIASRTNFRPSAKLPEQLLQAQQQPTWSASPYLV